MTRHDEYLALASTAGKRKLKAASLLAFGDEDSRFEAAVLLHEAAELDRRATSLLEDPSIETRLGAAVERCVCLLDGFDVLEASQAWTEVVALGASVTPQVASAYGHRLDPKYRATRRDLQQLLARAPVLTSAQFRWEEITQPDKPRARAELAALLERFPGEPMFHLVAARAAVDDRRLAEAGLAIRRAHRLSPGNPLLRAHLLLVMADSLAYPDATTSRMETEAHLAQIHAELQREPADAVVYLGFMTASLAAFLVASSKGEDAEVHRQRALWAAEEGAKRPSIVSADIQKHNRAAGLLIKLLMEQPDALTSIIEVALRDVLRETGIEEPLARVAAPPTPASLIHGVTLKAARWLPPQPAVNLAA